MCQGLSTVTDKRLWPCFIRISNTAVPCHPCHSALPHWISPFHVRHRPCTQRALLLLSLLPGPLSPTLPAYPSVTDCSFLYPLFTLLSHSIHQPLHNPRVRGVLLVYTLSLDSLSNSPLSPLGALQRA